MTYRFRRPGWKLASWLLWGAGVSTGFSVVWERTNAQLWPGSLVLIALVVTAAGAATSGWWRPAALSLRDGCSLVLVSPLGGDEVVELPGNPSCTLHMTRNRSGEPAVNYLIITGSERPLVLEGQGRGLSGFAHELSWALTGGRAAVETELSPRATRQLLRGESPRWLNPSWPAPGGRERAAARVVAALATGVTLVAALVVLTSPSRPAPAPVASIKAALDEREAEIRVRSLCRPVGAIHWHAASAHPLARGDLWGPSEEIEVAVHVGATLRPSWNVDIGVCLPFPESYLHGHFPPWGSPGGAPWGPDDLAVWTTTRWASRRGPVTALVGFDDQDGTVRVSIRASPVAATDRVVVARLLEAAALRVLARVAGIDP